MIPLTLGELARVVGGEIHDGDEHLMVTGPAFLDSRDPEPGGLFAAFVGERADGHAHAAAAVAAGAAAVLGSRATGVPTVVVDDVAEALAALARTTLDRLRAAVDLTVLAVTGSQGKTTVKDMLARVLADHAPTVATHGSFNNELGLPLTVLRADAATRFLVLEMGARGIDHLSYLCGIARPDVSVVLNVGTAHIGEFGSRENIARAKGELVEALGPDGTAVLNADDPLVAAMAARTRGRVLTFGETGEVRLGEVDTDELGRTSFTLTMDGRSVSVRLQLLGRHQAGNAAAVAAAAYAVGLGSADIARSLAAVDRLSRWRMELSEREDGLVVVNDAYNANPASMRAALETVAGIGARSGRRTLAVLGEMRELGESGAEEHRAAGALAAELGYAAVLAVGPGAEGIAAGGAPARHVGTLDEAATWLRDNVRRTDVVLVKASRAAGLERLAEGLLAATAGHHDPGATDDHDQTDHGDDTGDTDARDVPDAAGRADEEQR